MDLHDKIVKNMEGTGRHLLEKKFSFWYRSFVIALWLMLILLGMLCYRSGEVRSFQ